MCQLPSCCVTKDKRLLADLYIHSHSMLAEINGFPDDAVAKYEYDLVKKELVIDNEPDWVKKSHQDIALRYFEKHYKADEDFRATMAQMDTAEIDNWEMLHYQIQTENTPPCPWPCPYPCPYPHLCLCLSEDQLFAWEREWLIKWTETIIEMRNSTPSGSEGR